MSSTLLPVVEGDGEVGAVRILLRRICGEVFGRWDVEIRQPWRLPRSQMTMQMPIGRVYRALARGLDSDGGVIVVLDQDDDHDVSRLIDRVSEPMAGMADLRVVVACREYEAWFLGGIESLRVHRSVRDDASFDSDPEAPRDAKGRLRQLMNEPYRETLHQPAFTELLSIGAARQRCPSFDHLVQAVGELIGAANAG